MTRWNKVLCGYHALLIQDSRQNLSLGQYHPSTFTNTIIHPSTTGYSHYQRSKYLTSSSNHLSLRCNTHRHTKPEYIQAPFPSFSDLRPTSPTRNWRGSTPPRCELVAEDDGTTCTDARTNFYLAEREKVKEGEARMLWRDEVMR